jgi:hypothetical protein
VRNKDRPVREIHSERQFKKQRQRADKQKKRLWEWQSKETKIETDRQTYVDIPFWEGQRES